MLELSAVQREAFANKVRKGFNTTDVALEFGLMTSEVSEAFTAWYRGQDVGEELADIVIYVAGLAEILGVDLDEEVRRKLAINRERVYVPLPNGALVKRSQR
jgi:NTP pyrophosphatase (non-canonical NTP hydrolase)